MCKVSIIIPTYNRAEMLRRCLDSLVQQSFKNFEVLVCDDGSTDHTLSVVESFIQQLDIVYDYSSHFGGPARPRNRGIELARGQYLAFLDSDDWWVPDKLGKCIFPLDHGEDIVFHNLMVFDVERKKVSRKRMYSLQPNNVYESLLCYGKSILTSSVIIKAEIMRKIGGFREDKILIAVEDWEAWLRVAQVTTKFFRINEFLGYYGTQGDNISAFKLPETVDKVYDLHVNNLSTAKRIMAQSMRAYDLGRIYEVKSDYKKAVPLLRRSLCEGPLAIVRLKSLCLLIVIFFKKLLQP